MPWYPALDRLRDVLAELYPDMADARRVAASVSLRVEPIDWRGMPRDVWRAIVEEAESKGQVEAIIAAARTDYPQHVALATAASYYQWVAVEPPYEQDPAAVPPGGLASSADPAAEPTTSLAGGGVGPLALDLGCGIGLRLALVPGGEFTMGSANTDRFALDAEKPQHNLWLPEYLMGKYPVTRLQYRAFVQASRYEASAPQSLRGADDRPVVHVTWRDAMAFCAWASEVSGQMVRLPSEAEWEKAARGAWGRLYPWGNRWDAHCCNCKEGGPGKPTPVGLYSPLGDSPYGCADMMGNVWEWTRSLWGADGQEPQFRYPYDPHDGREELYAGEEALRAVRGGSFYDGEPVRCAARARGAPGYRSDDLGFRVMVVPGSS